MSIYDQIRANAQAKDGFVANAPSRGTTPYRRGLPDPVALAAFSRQKAAPNVRITDRVPNRNDETLKRLRQIIDNNEFTPDAGGVTDKGEPGGLAGLARSAFGGIITVADALKSGYQQTAGEVGDLTANLGIVGQIPNRIVNPFGLRGAPDADGNRNTSFDLGNITFKDSQFLEAAPWTEDLPGVVKPVVGFAGDVVTDPLTYLTAGVGKAAVGAATGVSRAALAQNLAREGVEGAAIRGLVGGADDAARIASQEVIDEVTKKAGTMGLGALTTKSLKKVGTSADELRAAGINVPDFRYTLGAGKKLRVQVAPEKFGEAVEYYKGMAKQFVGTSKAGTLARKMAFSSKTGERELMDEILGGGADGATAALALTMMRKGRGEGYKWMFAGAEELKRLGLNKADDKTYKRITWELENLAEDQMSPLTIGVRDWLRKAGDDLAQMGIEGADGEVLRLRQGYVPHRLTQEAMDNIDSPAVKKYLRNAGDRKEAFQKSRELEGTIDEINAAFKADTGMDFNLLKDDVTDLVSDYLEEGKDAIMRSYAFGKQARDVGLVSRMDGAVDTGKVRKAVENDVKAAQDQINKAVKVRRRALDIAVDRGRKARTKQAKVATDARTAQEAAQGELKRLTSEFDNAKKTLQSRTAAAAAARRTASQARGAEKAAATRAVRKAEAGVAKAQKDVDELAQVFAKAEKDFGRHAENLRVAEADLSVIDKELQDRMRVRQAMNDHPLTTDARKAAEASENAEAAVQRQEIAFAEAKTDWQTAGTTNAWLAADNAKAATKAEQTAAKFDEHLNKLTPRGKVSAKGKAADGLNVELRDRVRGLTLALKETDDPKVSALLKLETQAAVADMQAAMLRGRATDLSQASFEEIMNNPRWQEFVSLQARAGHAQIGDTPFETSAWYKNAMEKQAEFMDPATRSQAWQNANKAIRGYRKVLGWWKGYAVATPGFHIRNMYSGGFGMYLDGVTPNDARRFEWYRRQWAKNGPEEAKKMAAKRWDQVTADQLDEAVTVTAASGWGITMQEAERSLVGSHWGVNPLKTDEFFVTKGSQKVGEVIEAGMRGGHAFSVLRRGGSYDEALQRVQKFHFNYRDISEFDQAAKMVMPFWTFFSRNMALQAQVWAKNPGKLNRSYFNLKRNLEFMSEEDADGVIPDYLLHDMGGIRTPWGGSEGGRMYITPDLPSIRFQGQMEDPLGQVIGGLAPYGKIPLEALTNTNQFTGQQFKNELTQMSADGPIARMAPGVLQLPGVKQATDLLPGTRIVNGDLLMTDRTQSQLEGLNPMLGRANRLFPNMPRRQETRRQAVGGFFGAPIRWNDPGAQAGERARRRDIINNEAAALALEAKLKELTGG